MYTLIHETDSATTVNLSVYGRFLPSVGGGSGRQLVTVGGRTLRMFRFNPYALTPGETPMTWAVSTRLECVFDVRLFAPVQSMAVARLPSHPSSDSLLLAFDEAKLSIVCMDESEHCMKTLSLHSFEDEMLRDGFTRDQTSPEVRCDPSNRCAVMLVYGRHLAVVPFTADPLLSSYTVALCELDARLENVRDIAFLDGYYEPTLLFLYEPMQTTAGRASIRFDTTCILGVSLNVTDRVQAVVWQLAHLPMDCSRLLALPVPVGGALLVGVNDVVYLNQSVPPCGIATNSCLEGFTGFPLRDTARSFAVSLDGSAVAMISPSRVAIAARDGRLFMLELQLDETTGAVKALALEHVFDTCIPHTLTACAGGYLFIGSRLGDSQLLQYWWEGATVIEKQMQTKRVKMEETMRGDAREEEDLELYGQYLQPTTMDTMPTMDSKAVMKLRVLDRLVNRGPCKTLCIGCPAHLSAQLPTPRVDPFFDLVTASGHGKDGAVCILQRSIRPDVITSIAALGSVHTERVWTVGRREDDSQRWLLVARPMQTLVLELGNEMVETDQAGFDTARTTVAAGELADGALAVQVTPMSVILVSTAGSGTRLQQLDLDLNFPITTASIVDPHIALLTENGRLLMLQVDGEAKVTSVAVPAGINAHAPISAICLYRDMSGLFNFCSSDHASHSQSRAAHVASTHSMESTTAKAELPGEKVDDEDFLLYADSKVQSVTRPDTALADQRSSTWSSRKRPIATGMPTGRVDAGGLDTDVLDPNAVMPTSWLVVARESGQLQIVALPELRVVWSARRSGQFPEVLIDAPDDELSQETVKSDEIIVEVLCYGMGFNQARPILMAVADQQVAIYSLFPFDDGIGNRLAVRFRRLPVNVVARSERFTMKDGKLRPTGVVTGGNVQQQMGNVEGAGGVRTNGPLLFPFDRIGNQMNGVFVAGPYPSWVLLGAGPLRVHPMTIDGPARAFAAFNNASCEMGFLYVSEREAKMRIARLATDFELDASCPVRKVAMNRTVHFVLYQLQSNTYAMVSSESEECKKLAVMIGEERNFEMHEKGPDFVYPMVEQYFLHLYSPDDWSSPIAHTEMRFAECEIVSSFAEVLLKSESTVSGMQEFLAIGTACNYGEEILVRGRIVLAQVIEVVPEPGQPTSRHRIKPVYDKEQKGPISAICSCRGYLLTAMAQKVFIWLLRDNDLQGISFLDMHFYVHQLVGLRNLALAADLYHSVSLIRYQEDCKALSLASRDARSSLAPPMAVEFMVDGRGLGMISSDEAGTITVFAYQPETKESLGGQRLIVRSQINQGARINAFARVRCHVGDGLVENPGIMRHRQTCIFATLDGSLGSIIPLGEKVFRRLHMLQQVMSAQLPHAAGLNPRASRAARCAAPGSGAAAGARAMIDGDLVFMYLTLSQGDKLDFAKRLGTSRHQLVDDLVELQRLVTHF